MAYDRSKAAKLIATYRDMYQYCDVLAKICCGALNIIYFL